MDTIFRSSEPLPSLHSFQSLQKRLNDSGRSSVHLLAYLSQDSARSIKSVSSHETNQVDSHATTLPSERPDDSEAWWSDLIDLKPFNLRPLSDFGVNLTSSLPEDKLKSSRFGTAPARPRRRPPPLQLDPHIVSSRKENISPSAMRYSTRPKISTGISELDSSSPWFILNQFPAPPVVPSLIRGSKTNTDIHKLSGGIDRLSPCFTPTTKGSPIQQVEYQPSLSSIKKKRRSSFGSLGRALKTTQVSMPHTAPPIPPIWLQSDPMCTMENRSKSSPGLQRRDTFKSRLFSIGTSPKAISQGFDFDGGEPLSNSVSRRGNRTVSESAQKSVNLRECARPIEPRSRSVSQPIQSRNKKDKMGTKTGSRDDIPPLPKDFRTHLVIPERRIRSPSYFSIPIPPRKQADPSPTQTVFSPEDRVSPTMIIPGSENLDRPEETMYLPASGSVASLTADLDPFGAGEPVSFFRMEYGASTDKIQATTTFHRIVSLDMATSNKLSSAQESGTVHQVPNIVISSSGCLEELRE
ncbi:unnamed protein product [Rhizoctonia solani]|uniref:Uncharacterized protein n=1 Tax=Rhizoctonia solani TaxID=456999 RepID=A0A8H2XQU3_9AGAM|nr:unnamed protein product [Rhizoctonia solani]